MSFTYDFNKLIYSNTNTSEYLEKNFNLLKKLIFNYLKNDSFSVCSFIKDYKYGGENELINEFINYHDKWTKANLKNTILI